MIPEIGHFLLIIATSLALLIASFTLFWGRPIEAYLARMTQPLTLLMATCALLATATLVYAFLVNDFSVAYVAHHSNTHLAWYFKVAALWGGHEGSILFWTLGLTVVTARVAAGHHYPNRFAPRASNVLAMINFGFLLFVLFTSNPFSRLLPEVPVEGRDLNPMLQDIGLILHPPMVFLGYVALTVLFAGAITTLLSRGSHNGDSGWFRRWNLIAWFFLTLGNLFGSWWAYNELGWGGWWFWDPVENASFIPWLISCALLHTLHLNRSENAMTLTTLLLCLSGFSVSLIGTFLVRSGVIQSVHAFAADPNRGMGILILLLATILPALVVFALRAPRLKRGTPLRGGSNHWLVMVASLLLITAAFSVLLGTCYPFIFSAMGLGSISVGAPYFNTVFIPIVSLCAGLLGWVSLPQATWSIRNKIALAVMVILAATGLGLYQDSSAPVWMWQGFVSAFWIGSCLLIAAAHQFKHARLRLHLPSTLAHAGVAVFILGATVLSNFEQAAMVRMGPGNGKVVAGLTAVYEQTDQVEHRAYRAMQGTVRIENSREHTLTYLYPQRRTYMDDMSEMTIAGVYHSLLSDLYLSMGPAVSDSEYLVRISYKPWVRLLWIGGLICAFAGALAWRRTHRETHREYPLC
ncbi:heme lyase CcmF/NrfE family subunit [Ferrimonas sp. SCSIO 43195]|uniref:heme lyase CcmF/NrfE family subunit n=1 Tax=Ferrimonas sp. SCSIO 43195 TaxID=2822844 RepID=UPI00207519BB|nr:heme lyase NrfEFG subunit NrfE [Ferrimonas sp. SCSIO 43195]USD38165.1 heme lyase NrfEFG subunit NrfE [Ferrimonas sp. SCSIO 43195]